MRETRLLLHRYAQPRKGTAAIFCIMELFCFTLQCADEQRIIAWAKAKTPLRVEELAGGEAGWR